MLGSSAPEPCVTQSVGLNSGAWKELLPVDDSDYEFIISGVTEGFRIIDKGQENNIRSVHCPNHKSALIHRDKVESQRHSVGTWPKSQICIDS